MKRIKIILFSTLLVFAFAMYSCGSAGEKAKTEEVEVECENVKKDTCDHAKKDTCAHAVKDTCNHEEEKEHKHGEDCDH